MNVYTPPRTLCCFGSSGSLEGQGKRVVWRGEICLPRDKTCLPWGVKPRQRRKKPRAGQNLPAAGRGVPKRVGKAPGVQKELCGGA